jgi:hypothetical protein
MLLIKPWDTSIPMLSNMGWMSPTVPWLTWTCFSHTSNLFWGLILYFTVLPHIWFVYVVLWPMMNNLMNNYFVMLLIKPWDTSIPMLSNMGWMSPTVPWLTWTCFTYTTKLFWGLILYFTVLPHICFCLCCPLAYDEL